MKKKICLLSILILALTATMAASQTLPFPSAPTNTPLLPSWPYIPTAMASFAASQFYAGDYVCLDIANMPLAPVTGVLYVVDNGLIRCQRNMPQAGLVYSTDLTPTTIHQVVIDPDLPKGTPVCSLGGCQTTAVNLIVSCDSVRMTQCAK